MKDERNRVLHAVWLTGFAGGGPVRINFRRGKTSVNVLGEDSLRTLAHGFEALSMRGSNVLRRLQGERPIEIDDPWIGGEE